MAVYETNNTTTADNIGEKTVTFLHNLETHIPKIVEDIKSNKKIGFTITTAFLNQYGEDLKLCELLNLQSSFNATMGAKLGKLLSFILIESILTACEDNLKKHNVENHYLEQVKKSIDNIKKMLHATEKIDSENLTKDENKAINSMLEALEYQKLITLLNITLKDVQTKFEASVKKAVKYFLDKDGMKVLKEFLQQEIFNKIKNNTTLPKLSTLLQKVTGSIDSAQKVMTEWANYLANK
jgi:hypothetical protein